MVMLVKKLEDGTTKKCNADKDQVELMKEAGWKPATAEDGQITAAYIPRQKTESEKMIDKLKEENAKLAARVKELEKGNEKAGANKTQANKAQSNNKA